MCNGGKRWEGGAHIMASRNLSSIITHVTLYPVIISRLAFSFGRSGRAYALLRRCQRVTTTDEGNGCHEE